MTENHLIFDLLKQVPPTRVESYSPTTKNLDKLVQFFLI